MDYDFLSDLENFEGVWNRVCAQENEEKEETAPPVKAPAQPCDRDVLREFIEDENKAAVFYSAMARQCSGKNRATLIKLSSDERTHMRNLQLEYFILTGDSYAPPKLCPSIDGTLSALRVAYIYEQKAYEKFIRAAENTKNEDLAKLYREIAFCEAKHVEVVRCMLERALGE